MTITQVEAINHLQNKSNFSVETKMINNIIKASFSNNFIFLEMKTFLKVFFLSLHVLIDLHFLLTFVR